MDKETYQKKLYYSCKDTYSKSWESTASIPPKIMFELTNACNHKCIFCANRKMRRKIGFLKKNVFFKIASEAFDLGVREIALYTTGESLLHPEIVDFVEIVKKIGFGYIYLSTNGVLLTPVLSKKLINAGLDSIRISINAGTKESYKKIHGRDDFDKVIENIMSYDSVRKEMGNTVMLSASCVLTKDNLDEKEKLEKLLGPHIDVIKWTEVRIQGGLMVDTIRKIAIKKNDDRYSLKPCGLLWNGMHVDYEGNLTLCCVDFNGEIVVGNILKEGLLACWNGPKMQEQRQLHLAGSLNPKSLCYKCLTGLESSEE
jgi:MoaA/NifB/PqqE/SkfB family radical SAM enzyme